MKPRQGPIMNVAAPLRSLVQRFAYLGLVATAFAVMMVGKADTVLMETVRAHVNDAVAPILNVLSRPAATVSDVVDEARALAALRAENARLREENARLLQWHAVARRLESENAQLRALSNYIPEGAERFVTARVIADSGGAFARSLLLSAGAADGVRKGQAVINGEGLVGRVAGVGQRTARVLLATDLNSRIPVVVESSGTRGILAGDNSPRPRLVHLPAGAEVSPGQRVVTSGHGGAFPRGLPVGVVAAVAEERIDVQLLVRRERLEYVRVVDFGLSGILDLPREPKAGGG